MKRLNVLLYSNLFPNPQQPDRGVFTFQIAQKLKEKCDITIASPLPWCPNIPIQPWPKRWSVFAKIPYSTNFKNFKIYYPKYFMLPKIGDYFSYFTTYTSLCRLLKNTGMKNEVDLINAHWAYPDGVAAEMASRRFGIPVVISLMGSDINRDMRNPYLHKHIKKSLIQCARIVTVSTELKESIVNYGINEDKIAVIHNGVDFENFPLRNRIQCREELGLEQNKYTIVFIGRLEHVKGISTLVGAVKERRQFFSTTKIVLVGDGSLASELKAEVKQNNLQDIFLFVGSKSHDSISKWYGAADLFCLPSLNEGHPNVVMEALASGRPVVASNVGAISQFVTSQVGEVFDAGDPKKLAMALLNTISREWSPKLIRASVSNMSWHANAEKYLAEFKNTVEKKRTNEN